MWTKECLRGGLSCYKNTFYGIDTAGCLEMSPALTCNQRCQHCWRDTSIFSNEWEGPVDEPDDIKIIGLDQAENAGAYAEEAGLSLVACLLECLGGYLEVGVGMFAILPEHRAPDVEVICLQ